MWHIFDEQYNSERLTNILVNLTDMIGAKILNIAKQDYEPQGASVTILISEESKLPSGEIQLAHLDKSHVTVHTYPEYHPESCLATFRVDIEVGTCGEITPLSTLNYLIQSFDSDISYDGLSDPGILQETWMGRNCSWTTRLHRSRNTLCRRF